MRILDLTKAGQGGAGYNESSLQTELRMLLGKTFKKSSQLLHSRDEDWEVKAKARNSVLSYFSSKWASFEGSGTSR